MKFLLLSLIFLGLLSGCVLPHRSEPLSPLGEGKFIDPLRPVTSSQNIQLQVSDELATTRKLAMAGIGLGILSTLILRSVAPQAAGIAVAGLLSSVGIYITALLVAFTLPWLPWVALGVLIVLILLVIRYASAHWAPIKKAFDHFRYGWKKSK